MKKLKNLRGAKELSKAQQQAIKGGRKQCGPDYPCPPGYPCIVTQPTIGMGYCSIRPVML